MRIADSYVLMATMWPHLVACVGGGDGRAASVLGLTITAVASVHSNFLLAASHCHIPIQLRRQQSLQHRGRRFKADFRPAASSDELSPALIAWQRCILASTLALPECKCMATQGFPCVDVLATSLHSVAIFVVVTMLSFSFDLHHATCTVCLDWEHAIITCKHS